MEPTFRQYAEYFLNDCVASLNADKTAACFQKDKGVFRYGNFPDSVGYESIVLSVQGFTQILTRVHHQIDVVLPGSANDFYCTGVVFYETPQGHLANPFAVHFELETSFDSAPQWQILLFQAYTDVNNLFKLVKESSVQDQSVQTQ
jgi:hypothetical protein